MQCSRCVNPWRRSDSGSWAKISVHNVADEAFDCPTVDQVDEATARLHAWAVGTSSTVDGCEPLAGGVYPDYDEAVRFTSVAGLTTRRDQEASRWE